MKRILFGALLVALVACTEPREPPADADGATRPNILLYLVDTLRADRVGAYGYPKPTSPTLDRLAAEGVVFEQAYAPGPWTLPSVVSIMLSQPSCRHGVEIDGVKISPESTPLAEILADAGYRTASLIANAYAGRPAGLERGFEVYAGPVDDPARHVASFLEKTDEAKPFFLYVHDVRPHDPFDAGDEAMALFGDVDHRALKRLRNRSLRYRRLTRVDHAAGDPPGTTDNTTEQRQALARLDEMAARYRQAYDARVREADGELAATLDVLHDRGVLDETVVVVLSDHGEEFGEHQGWLHDQSVYDEVVRAPLIVRLPGSEHAGARVDAPVSLLDVAPTLADLAGVPTPDGAFEGTSLVPRIEGRAVGGEPLVATIRLNRKKYFRPWKESRGDHNLVVRDGRWKAIWNVEPDTIELYDLAADPGESRDLHAAHPDVAGRLRARARDYLERCSARRSKTGPPEKISKEALERLRALGYVD